MVQSDKKDFKDMTLGECWNMTLGEFIKMFFKETLQMRSEETSARVIQEVLTLQTCNFEMEVSEILRELGVPANILGHKYLRDAIVYALKEPKAIKGITKILYPEVARLNDTTSSRVEKAIRHAMKVTWERGDIDVMYGYFGNSIDIINEKPTNGKFIAGIVDHLKLKYNLS